MWQLYVNLFFYSFCYYIAKPPLAEVSKDITLPSAIDKFNENGVFTATVMGSLLLGLFQDKVGTRFALNLSQLSSFLIYAVGLLRFEQDIIARAGPGAVAALKVVPSSAFLLIKILPVLQHSMQIGKAGMVCLRPWDSPRTLLSRVCWALVAYSAGLYAGTLLVDSFQLKGFDALAVAAISAFVAWFLNFLTFPNRQRAPKAPAGVKVEGAGSYLDITLRYFKLLVFYLIISIAAQSMAKYLGDQTNNAPKPIADLGTRLGVKVEYLLSPVVAIFIIPALASLFRGAGGVLRFVSLLSIAVVAWDQCVKGKFVPPMETKDAFWAVSIISSRISYLVPWVFVAQYTMPGQQGQMTALLGVVSSLAGKLVPIFWSQGLDVIKEVVPPTVPVSAEAVLTVSLLFTVIVVTVAQDRSAAKGLGKKKAKKD